MGGLRTLNLWILNLFLFWLLLFFLHVSAFSHTIVV